MEFIILIQRFHDYSKICHACPTESFRRAGTEFGAMSCGSLLRRSVLLFCCFVLCLSNPDLFAQEGSRKDISLNDNWETIVVNNSKERPFYLFEANEEWKKVNIPHNWDSYEGYRRLVHGNRHGDAWYRKKFSFKQTKAGKRFFLFFEGVGSYATVFLNDEKVGEHAGGRTTFTIDVTAAIKTDGSDNLIIVRASHPANIKDLPWVCGGCSDERGFSEGSQPMGIFRPVHLVITNDALIVPFGVHAYASIKEGTAVLNINTTVKSYRNDRNIFVHTLLLDKNGKVIMEEMTGQYFANADSLTIEQSHKVSNVQLWSPSNPYLYRIVSYLEENSKIIDKIETAFGFRTINWKTSTHQFVINDKPVFINGVAEYEHLLGQSHAFSHEQIQSRMKWVKAAGFNAFRDAHQPHNLLYGQLCDTMGILWWTQFSAHIWYDSPEFRNNFKQLLKEWVIERRNDPSVILWGLQNESKLPEDFAKECTALIRSLDPTASSQRLITTCNGGSGTDWDVPQNWTGTYGGDPTTYASDIKKQVLIGEYGAWRMLDLHTEGGFEQNGVLSEDRMVQLMEQKIRLAESVKESCAGQFFWLLTSHDNPGRVQGGEGFRELDRIGPVNYKGLLTSWEEPTDAFYMFRSNYAPKETDPMVYIVSHTWPNRWIKPGLKDGIIVYSNCDEVELFNDVNSISLGKRKRSGVGTHFQWDKVNIQYNVLFAIGYVNGKPVAKDTIVLNHLPPSPQFNKLYSNSTSILKPQSGYNYVYRLNCGGPEYKDENENVWSADNRVTTIDTGSSTPKSRLHYRTASWTNDFPGIPAFFASQRRTFSPIKGSKDWQLFQTFRYGRDKLSYEFSLPDGAYKVELYFIEPWLGIGGGMDCRGMRLFDVAINGETVLHDLDIWKEAATNTALKKIVDVTVKGGTMVISFPETHAGQAIIAAIAIATLQPVWPGSVISQYGPVKYASWLDIGDRQYINSDIKIRSLPSNLFGANWFQFEKDKTRDSISFTTRSDVDVFVGIDTISKNPPYGYENTRTQIVTDEGGGKIYTVFRKQFAARKWIRLSRDQFNILKNVSNMQPAYDLKPITQYKASVALTRNGVNKEDVQGRECAVIKTNGETTTGFPIQTGVADRYSITMKYYFSRQTPVKGRLQLIGSGNAMMLDEEVTFTFTNPGKWNQFTINTGNMINAGNYEVRLIITGAEGLAISGVDIQ